MYKFDIFGSFCLKNAILNGRASLIGPFSRCLRCGLLKNSLFCTEWPSKQQKIQIFGAKMLETDRPGLLPLHIF